MVSRCVRFILCSWALALPICLQAQVSTRDGFLRELRALQQSEQKELMVLDEGLKKILKSSSLMNAPKLRDPDTKSELIAIRNQIEEASDQREERLARQEFLNQLLSLTESKTSTGTDMKSFLWTQLLEMAGTQLGLQTGSSPQPQIATFFVYLSIAIRELPEASDSLVRFIEAYTKYSSLLDPKDPTGFAEKYQYIGSRPASPTPTKTPGPISESTDYETGAVEAAPRPSPGSSVRPQ